MSFIKDATAVEGSVRTLQGRVSNIMIVIVNNVVAGDDDPRQVAIGKAAEEIQKDVIDLKRRVLIPPFWMLH